MEWIDSADDVIAINISGKITGSDLEAIMDRLEAAMSRHNEVHVFVETHALSAIEIAGLPSYIARAIPLFRKLRHFGRVAVVADQSWIRVGTRIESALLPGIRYRAVGPEERDQALSWVQGRQPNDSDG